MSERVTQRFLEECGVPIEWSMIDFAQQAEASGTPFLNLRLNLYMQGLLLFKNLIASHGVIAASIGDALVSLIDVREIAAVATGTESGHEGHTCNLTDPQALSPRPKTDERQTKARSDKPRKRPAANRKVRKRVTSRLATHPSQKANGPARNGTQWAPAAGSPAADQTAQRKARATEAVTEPKSSSLSNEKV